MPTAGSQPAASSPPQGFTLAGLRSFARGVGHPVYWIGPMAGTTYEVTQTAGARIFLRYLPKGQKVGTTTPFLTVGTYPVANAVNVTRTLTKRAGSVRIYVGKGAVAFYARSHPTNVYEAFPGIGYQIEVYDPSASESKRLVLTHRVVPIS